MSFTVRPVCTQVQVQVTSLSLVLHGLSLNPGLSFLPTPLTVGTGKEELSNTTSVRCVVGCDEPRETRVGGTRREPLTVAGKVFPPTPLSVPVGCSQTSTSVLRVVITEVSLPTKPPTERRSKVTFFVWRVRQPSSDTPGYDVKVVVLVIIPTRLVGPQPRGSVPTQKPLMLASWDSTLEVLTSVVQSSFLKQL